MRLDLEQIVQNYDNYYPGVGIKLHSDRGRLASANDKVFSGVEG